MSMMPGNPCHKDADFPYPGMKRGLSLSRSKALLDRCVWSESSDGFWESSCKYAFEFHNGTPFQNGFRFCPKCGKKIKRSNVRSEARAKQEQEGA